MQCIDLWLCTALVVVLKVSIESFEQGFIAGQMTSSSWRRAGTKHHSERSTQCGCGSLHCPMREQQSTRPWMLHELYSRMCAWHPLAPQRLMPALRGEWASAHRQRCFDTSNFHHQRPSSKHSPHDNADSPPPRILASPTPGQSRLRSCRADTMTPCLARHPAARLRSPQVARPSPARQQ